VIEARAGGPRTGASWALDSLAAMGDEHTQDVRERALTSAMMEHQRLDEPVSSWPLCELRGDENWRESYRTVGRIMSTDLFTVRADDLVDLAANLMDWERIRHIPVEDDQGRLLGVVTHRTLLRTLARRDADSDQPLLVRDVMKADPHTVAPETATLDAMRLMRDRKVGCLPVVERGRLVGMVTEADLIDMSARLLERYLDEDRD
jgi:CBS domain-containing protein